MAIAQSSSLALREDGTPTAARDERARVRQRVLEQCRQHHLVQRGERVLVAVSGGQDSLCLLDALASLRHRLGIDLHVAHVNHGLRGRESEEDARFVAGVAADYGLPVTVASIDVADYRRRYRLGVQVAARAARYQVLAQVAAREGAAAVAVGHTRDDLVETLLMNLIRGTGLRGLAGIPPRQELRPALLGPPLDVPWRPPPDLGVVVIRPLLGVDRRQTLVCCQAAGLTPRLDVSNLTAVYLRNRVRQELVPVFERFNPSIRATIARTAEILRGDLEVVEQAAAHAWAHLARPSAKGVAFKRAGLGGQPPSLQRQLVRLAVEHLAGTAEGLRWAAVEAVLRQVASRRTGWRLDLSGAVEALAEKDALLIRRKPAPRPPGLEPPMLPPAPLPVPGRVDLGDAGIIEAQQQALPGEGATWRQAVTLARLQVAVDAAKLSGPLRVRPRRAGDRMVPLGLGRAKKLQDILVDAKVPRSLRGLIPVVEAGGEIVWLAGLRLDERFRLDEQSRDAVLLRYQPGRAVASLWEEPDEPV